MGKVPDDCEVIFVSVPISCECHRNMLGHYVDRVVFVGGKRGIFPVTAS